EAVEHLGHVVDVGRRAVQLEQIERLDLEVAQAALDVAGQAAEAVRGHAVRLRAATGLGGHVERRAGLAPQPGQQLFAAPVAVDVGGIEEVDAELDCTAQCRQRFVVGDRAPGAADRPRAEADGADLETGSSQWPCSHRCPRSAGCRDILTHAGGYFGPAFARTNASVVDPDPRLNVYGGVNTEPGLRSEGAVPVIPVYTLPVDLMALAAMLGFTKLVVLSGVFTFTNALFCARMLAPTPTPMQ